MFYFIDQFCSNATDDQPVLFVWNQFLRPVHKTTMENFAGNASLNSNEVGSLCANNNRNPTLNSTSYSAKLIISSWKAGE